MKRVIILVVSYIILIAGLVAHGQNFTVKQSSGFNIENSTSTGKSFKCEGKSFEIFTTKSGAEFVKGISATGNPYAIWIGTETSSTFQGMQVRKFKSGSYAVFTLNKNGYPKATYLDAN